MREKKCDDEGKFVGEVATRMSQILAELSTLAEENEVTRFLIALSGGPDSTALLVSLVQLSQKMGWELNVCHINHGLRGLESDLDQQFCQALCRDLCINFTSFRIDETRSAARSGHVPENLLRELRYSQLYEHARNQGIRLVLTGHTLDDQTETLLFRMFRGTSPTGLVGIESLREMVKGSGIWIARPLLSQTKIECQRFLAIEQIGAHFDSSNEDAHYARNYIRTQLIPTIDDKFPGWKNRIERLRVVIAEQEDWFGGETNRKLQEMLCRDQTSQYIERTIFQDCHIALKRRLAAQMLRDKLIEPTFDRIENVISMIDGRSDGALTLSLDWELRIDGDKVRWLPAIEDHYPSAFLLNQETVVRVPDTDRQSCTTIVTWLDKTLRVAKWVSESEQMVFPPARSLDIYADLGQVSGSLRLRLRRPGDAIQPFGMKEQVRLKKFLHTHDRASFFRHTVVLNDDAGILWVPGVGISERLRCTALPTHRLTFMDLAGPADSVWS